MVASLLVLNPSSASAEVIMMDAKKSEVKDSKLSYGFRVGLPKYGLAVPFRVRTIKRELDLVVAGSMNYPISEKKGLAFELELQGAFWNPGIFLGFSIVKLRTLLRSKRSKGPNWDFITDFYTTLLPGYFVAGSDNMYIQFNGPLALLQHEDTKKRFSLSYLIGVTLLKISVVSVRCEVGVRSLVFNTKIPSNSVMEPAYYKPSFFFSLGLVLGNTRKGGGAYVS